MVPSVWTLKKKLSSSDQGRVWATPPGCSQNSRAKTAMTPRYTPTQSSRKRAQLSVISQ